MSAEVLKIGVHGAGGRMGQRIVAVAHQDPACEVVAALESSSSVLLGQDAGERAGIGPIGVVFTSELTSGIDVIIDFSTPEASVEIAHLCEQRRIPLVVATTGFSAAQREEVLSAGQSTSLVIAPSMSLAVNVAMKLVGDAARALHGVPSGVDVEIVERHHRFKEDAPSGTALKFGEIVATEMGISGHVHGRSGRVGQRPRNEIGYHALRTGDNVGEHQIVFGLLGETLEISVRGNTRDSYAYGAVAAAKYAASRPAGIYSMFDVLGFAD